MKTLLVGGCSFTTPNEYIDERGVKMQSWPEYVAGKLDLNLVNLAWVGAGNSYIADSIQNYIIANNPDPNNTIVLVMWSGTTRKDVRVSNSFFQAISDYPFKTTLDGTNYLMAGDMELCLTSKVEWKEIFKQTYSRQTVQELADESLNNFIKLDCNFT